MGKPRRFYGTDQTDDYDTLAEVTLHDDGTSSLTAVSVDLHDVHQQCDRCGRKTWATEQFGCEDRMTQPDGKPLRRPVPSTPVAPTSR